MFTSLKEAKQIFSDIYKDAHGFRPTFDRTSWTLEDYNDRYESLQDTITRNMQEEAERKGVSAKEFANTVEACKQYGAKNDVDAIRWLLQAEEVDSMYEVEHWLWKHDILDTAYGTYIIGIINNNIREIL